MASFTHVAQDVSPQYGRVLSMAASQRSPSGYA